MTNRKFPQEQGGQVTLEGIQHQTKVLVEEIPAVHNLESETEGVPTKVVRKPGTSNVSREAPKVRVRFTDWASI